MSSLLQSSSLFKIGGTAIASICIKIVLIIAFCNSGSLHALPIDIIGCGEWGRRPVYQRGWVDKAATADAARRHPHRVHALLHPLLPLAHRSAPGLHRPPQANKIAHWKNQGETWVQVQGSACATTQKVYDWGWEDTAWLDQSLHEGGR